MIIYIHTHTHIYIYIHQRMRCLTKPKQQYDAWMFVIDH